MGLVAAAGRQECSIEQAALAVCEHGSAKPGPREGPRGPRGYRDP